MAERRTSVLPPAALAHVASRPHATLLCVESPLSTAVALARAGHHVSAVDRSEKAIRRLAATGVVSPVLARAEALPLDPCSFDAVVVHQTLHRLDLTRAASEMARVLRPGGHVAVLYLVRDDSVPWVRRFAAIVHQVAPEAMTGDYGHRSVEELLASKYFPTHDHRTFRVWVPMTGAGLLALVAAQPHVAACDATTRQQLLDEVSDLFHDTAGGSGTVRLPYELGVWRAFVDHDELTASIAVERSGLRIRL